MTKIVFILIFWVSFSMVLDSQVGRNKIIVNNKMQYDSLMKFYSIDDGRSVKTYIAEPTFLTSEDSIRCLNNMINEIDGLLNKIQNSKYSVSIFSIDKDKYIYKKNSNLLLTPASNTKLVTTFTAYDLMGADYKVKTEVLTDDPNIKDSVINGNLIFVGYGDALLSINDIEVIADKIKAKGIKKITGNIYADGYHYDKIISRWKYSGDVDEVEPVPPIAALSIEKNTATVIVSAGNQGSGVKVQIVPWSETYEIYNTASVRGSSGKRAEFDTDRKEIEYAGDEAISSEIAKKGISITTSINKQTGRQQFFIRGTLRANSSYSYQLHLTDPALAATGCLKQRLEAGNVIVEGKVLDYHDYEKDENFKCEHYTLFSNSRPLQSFIELINRNSDNYIAESVFKMIGAFSNANDNCAFGAKEAEKESLTLWEIPINGCKINDGSGLSRRNLLTTETLTELLISAYYSDFYKPFLSSLSLAGKYGTLRKRMHFTAAYDNLRAKTGTLRNASSLSGFVTSLEGELFVFSMIFNGNDIGTYKVTEDKIGNILASFFYYNEFR